jgi:hypothetical protein
MVAYGNAISAEKDMMRAMMPLRMFARTLDSAEEAVVRVERGWDV